MRVRDAMIVLIGLALVLPGCQAVPGAYPGPQPYPGIVSVPVVHPSVVYLPQVAMGYRPLEGKKGVAASYVTCSDVERMNVTWYHAWGPNPPICPGIEAVPGIWGELYLDEPLGGNSEWVLGFNEPDLESQANITPTLAAELWREVEQIHPDRKLVAPVPSQYNLTWLQEFYAAYGDQFGEAPRLDALAAHCYSRYASECMTVLDWYLSQAWEWEIGEVWVTEYAMFPCGGNSMADAVAEAEKLRAYLEAQPLISRYAWYTTKIMGDEWFWGIPTCNPSLIDWYTGQLTPFGDAYRVH